MNSIDASAGSDDFTTLEVAKLLGMSVRSVQLMVDRGELEAWKTPGGHRRIARASVDRWRSLRGVAKAPPAQRPAPNPLAATTGDAAQRPRVLLIDDSIHFQKLVALLIRQRFPPVELHAADPGLPG